MADWPQLPTISGPFDILLDVYTHPSIRSDTDNEEYGSIQRLAQLGKSGFDLAVTHCLYHRRPRLTATELVEQRDTFKSDANINALLDYYRLREKLRVAQGVDIYTPEESNRLWHTYIGALYIRNGLHAVQDWIGRLVDPQNYQPAAAPMQAAPLVPPPPANFPPPLPQQPQPQQPGAPITLALFNQVANQKRIAVTYPAVSEGPPHNLTWTVQCCLNGVERGRGVGKSQKIAKEQAFTQAWHAVGWQ